MTGERIAVTSFQIFLSVVDNVMEILTYTQNAGGIFQPSMPVVHRDDEYDQDFFLVLWEMQLRHFWYRGRHRFLLRATRQALQRSRKPDAGLSVVDLGGGCGGWIKYLDDHKPQAFAELSLADSSLLALEQAGQLLPGKASRYQVDLLNLGWKERWDVAYLLDVLEHLADDEAAMRQVAAALKPGGLVLVTMPALKFFWSYNDEVAAHQRRYDRSGLARLAEASGLRLLSGRYFMFFLSPLLWLSRVMSSTRELTDKQKSELAKSAHRMPPAFVNGLLTTIFCAETPLGHHIRFPWGTSILGIFTKD